MNKPEPYKKSMNGTKNKSLKEYLDILLEKSRSGTVLSVKEILEILSGKGRLLILVLLSLPFCLPIPIPGLSVPFGLVIAFIGLRWAFGKRIWLPKCILLKTISSKTIQKIVRKALYLLDKMKRYMYPRSRGLSKNAVLRTFNGLLIFLLGAFLALPLPIPLTNFVAAWAILLISLGLLQEDFVFVFIGYLFFLIISLILVAMVFSIKAVF